MKVTHKGHIFSVSQWESCLLAFLVSCLWEVFPAPCSVRGDRAACVSPFSKRSQGTLTCRVADLVLHVQWFCQKDTEELCSCMSCFSQTEPESQLSFMVVTLLIKYQQTNKRTLNSSLCHSATCSAKILCQDPVLVGSRLLLHAQEVQRAGCWVVAFIFLGSAVGLYNGKGKIVV